MTTLRSIIDDLNAADQLTISAIQAQVAARIADETELTSLLDVDEVTLRAEIASQSKLVLATKYLK
jgi:hypothetical protein